MRRASVEEMSRL